jgi:tRNA uridine 5-carboxymethylaminomethyl modification enzyme
LRQDNADQRLTPIGAKIGLVEGERVRRVEAKAATLLQGEKWVRQTNHEGIKLDQWFRRPENHWAALPDEIQGEFTPEIWSLLETDFKYEGHLGRQQQQISRMSKQEGRALPADLDYFAIDALKKEAKARFSEIRPSTVGQAARIPGITPADIGILAIWLEKKDRAAKA